MKYQEGWGLLHDFDGHSFAACAISLSLQEILLVSFFSAVVILV